jgi:hypothetical protein
VLSVVDTCLQTSKHSWTDNPPYGTLKCFVLQSLLCLSCFLLSLHCFFWPLPLRLNFKIPKRNADPQDFSIVVL